MFNSIRSAVSPVRTRNCISAVLAVAAFTACSDAAQNPASPDLNIQLAKGAAPSADVSVTTTLASGFSYSNDGAASYTNGSQGVVSIIQAIGDYVLETNAPKSTRATSIDFTDVVSGTAPFATATLKTRYIARITQVDATAKIQNMKSGDAPRAIPLAVSFDYASKSYRVAMNPNNQPGTEFAQIACTAPATVGLTCTAWQITPSGANGKNTARIIEVPKSGAEIARADVRMSFDISFAR